MYQMWNRNLRTELARECIGDSRARFVFLNNFEVETHWTEKGAVFPNPVSLGKSKAVVNRMEELGIFLAGREDVIVLKDGIDATYLSYLQKEGFELPQVVIVE